MRPKLTCLLLFCHILLSKRFPKAEIKLVGRESLDVWGGAETMV